MDMALPSVEILIQPINQWWRYLSYSCITLTIFTSFCQILENYFQGLNCWKVYLQLC